MDFTTLTIQVLTKLAAVGGSYGLAIILLTVMVRLAMWPLNTSQQRSMRKMQTLSPKLKELQARYQSDPPTMQKKMMEFYKEHKFNPFAGCFPLLIQMPIFIVLYAALMSPQFIETAGNTSFLFINRLDATFKSHAGVIKDGQFGVQRNDIFLADKKAEVIMADGTKQEVKVNDPRKAIEVQGDIQPGKPLDFKIKLDSLNLGFSELDKIKDAKMSVVNNSTKEVEDISFKRMDNLLVAEVPTVAVKTVYHYDVLILVLLFGLTMFLSQKVMTASNKNAAMDPTQEAMQKSMGTMMPVMITATFVFFPIPAGVLLYLVASNVIQIAQTVIINKQMDLEEQNKSVTVGVSGGEGAKPAKVNKVNDSK